mgnify:CR=1 FL=1
MSISVSELNSLALDVAKRVIPSLNANLKAYAKSAGWPDNVIAAMSVSYDSGDIFVDYPENLAAEIDDLEYGKPFGLPNPVIRPFMERNKAAVVDAIAGTTIDRILQMEEVF